MPKKKRTRKQKIQSDQRQSIQKQPLSMTSSTLPTNENSTQSTHAATQPSFSLPSQYTQHSQKAPVHHVQTATISTAEYAYLGRDLTKTALLTIGIIIAEIVIHIVMK